jgi:hypothetical protein
VECHEKASDTLDFAGKTIGATDADPNGTKSRDPLICASDLDNRWSRFQAVFGLPLFHRTSRRSIAFPRRLLGGVGPGARDHRRSG